MAADRAYPIPQSAPATETASGFARAAAAAMGNGRKGHILILDDDADFRAELAETLNLMKFAAQAIATVDELIETLNWQQPDFLLLDLAMPGIDGIDVLKLLAERSYAGDIVLVSGTEARVLETAARIGKKLGLQIAAALNKPVTASDIARIAASASLNADDQPQVFDEALRENAIRPYFQPKIDVKSGRIVGAEALSRWDHPEEGLLLPGTYIERLKNTGRQAVHDFRMLELTVAACRECNDAGHPLSFAVNFAFEVILSDTFIDVVKDVVGRYGIDPPQLILELSETGAAHSPDELAEHLMHLRLLNVQIALDGFGAGRSSLSLVQKMPLNEVKLDASIVSGMTQFPTDRILAGSIINLAHSLGLSVGALGVENAATAQHLREAGCDTLQGRVISPALDKEAFGRLIARDERYAF